MKEEQLAQRKRLVAGMLQFTHGTALQALPFEQHLLAEYAAGRLTLRRVESLLAVAAMFKD